MPLYRWTSEWVWSYEFSLDTGTFRNSNNHLNLIEFCKTGHHFDQVNNFFCNVSSWCSNYYTKTCQSFYNQTVKLLYKTNLFTLTPKIITSSKHCFIPYHLSEDFLDSASFSIPWGRVIIPIVREQWRNQPFLKYKLLLLRVRYIFWREGEHRFLHLWHLPALTYCSTNNLHGFILMKIKKP